MFQPPRCPHQGCPRFVSPGHRFYSREGSYQPKCRAHAVPRFRCRTCGRGFSRQTFRADYRDHKPHVNATVIALLTHGMGFRGTARLVGLSRRCLELKARKISRNAGRLDRNLTRRGAQAIDLHGSQPLRVHFDEFETFEGRRNTRPLTIAIAIESETRFHFGAIAAPIRPRGRMTDPRLALEQAICRPTALVPGLAAIAAEERRFGPRRNRSRAACRIALHRAAAARPGARFVALFTDEKTTYSKLARRAFGPRRIVHSRTKSVLPRTRRNPLFPINSEEADMRDKLSRLRRESWLVSKDRRYLDLHLALYSAWRNWVRPRFNRDKQSPAQLLGYAPRRLRNEELVGWRQDWGERSPDPIGRSAGPVGAAA